MRKLTRQLTPVIAQLAQSLAKLYETMNFQAEGFQLKQPSRQEAFIERLSQNDVAVQNISMLNQTIETLTKKFEDRELDNWSERQTLERQKAELEEFNDQRQQLSQLLTIQEESLKQLKTELEASEKQNASTLEKQFLGFVREIISVRDNLAMKEELLKEEENYQETKAWKLIQLSYRETEGILKRMGVKVIKMSGAFDVQSQMATETIPTHDEALHDTVAQTYREGYRTENKLIRAQEVVLYAYKK